MKKLFISICAIVALAFAAVSCDNGSGTVIYQGVVTVKSNAQYDSLRLQLDDETILIPSNVTTNKYKKEVRAYVEFEDKGSLGTIGSTDYRSAYLYYMDSILTKKVSPNLGPEENEKVYGNAPIDVYNSWMSVVEDGYMTLFFRGKWHNVTTKHTVSLVKTDDPYTFELRHNLNGDDLEGGWVYLNGMVAYDIKYLIDGSKQTYDIKVVHNADGGEKSFYFHYTPGKSAHISTDEVSAEIGELNLKAYN